MTDGFGSPVLGGGGALIRPSEHSPGYTPGVSGWSINKDGSAEFNNLTIRGTFNGTDYIINAAGVFLYNGIPALNNLVTSVASQDGVDSFGNTYLNGVSVYDIGTGTGPIGYIQMIGQTIVIGSINAGVFQVLSTGAGSIFGSGSDIGMASSIDPTNSVATADQAGFNILSGKAASLTGSGLNPFMQLQDTLGTASVDFLLSGAMTATDLLGNIYTWQVPGVGTASALVAGWTVAGFAGDQTFQYTRDTNDCVVLDGEITTPAVIAGTTTSLLVAPMAAPYIPKKGRRFPIYQSTGAAGAYATGIIHNDGNLFVQNVTALAAGNIVSFNQRIPLGNLK